MEPLHDRHPPPRYRPVSALVSGRGFQFFDKSHRIELERSVPDWGDNTENVLKCRCRKCAWLFAEWCIEAKDGEVDDDEMAEFQAFKAWKASQASQAN